MLTVCFGRAAASSPPLRRHVPPQKSHCHTPPRGDVEPRIQVREGVLYGRLATSTTAPRTDRTLAWKTIDPSRLRLCWRYWGSALPWAPRRHARKTPS